MMSDTEIYNLLQLFFTNIEEETEALLVAQLKNIPPEHYVHTMLAYVKSKSHDYWKKMILHDGIIRISVSDKNYFNVSEKRYIFPIHTIESNVIHENAVNPEWGPLHVNGTYFVSSDSQELVDMPITVRSLNVTGNLRTLKGCPKILEDLSLNNLPELTSLEGCPDKLFNISIVKCPKLKTLQFGPTHVTERFYLAETSVDSMKYFPLSVGEDFVCIDNRIENLAGFPQKVGCAVFLGNNKIKSLRGMPSEINGTFSCSYNELTDLEGCPVKINGNFICNSNFLTSTRGCPSEIAGRAMLIGNQLEKIDFLPDNIGYDLYYTPDRMNDEELERISKNQRLINVLKQ